MTATPPLRARGSASGVAHLVRSSAPADPDQLMLAVVGETRTDEVSVSRARIAAQLDWASRRQLDQGRANILRSLVLDPDSRVLEIGCETGALTRYLGETVAAVDALEADAELAAIAASRTAGLPHVRVFAGTLDGMPAESEYDVVLLVAGFEAAGGGEDLDAYVDVVRAASERLTAEGTLVIAVQNALGVKYLAGSPDDVVGEEGPSFSRDPGIDRHSFTRAELERIVSSAGLTASIRAVFPDVTIARAVLDLPALEATAAELIARLPSFPSPDRPAFGDWEFEDVTRFYDEGRAWSSFVDAGIAADTANAFLVLASANGSSALWDDTVLAQYFSVGRRAACLTQNTVALGPEGLVVRRIALHPDAPAESMRVRSYTEPYVRGAGMLDRLATETDRDRVRRMLSLWRELVLRDATVDGGVLWDLVPHNLVLTDDGLVHAIDQEWVSRDASREAVLRRGCFWSAARLHEDGARPAWTTGGSVEAVARDMGGMVGLDSDGDWLDRFYSEEASSVFDTLDGDARYEPEDRIDALRMHLAGLGSAEFEKEVSMASVVDRRSFLSEREQSQRERDDLQREKDELQAERDGFAAETKALHAQIDELRLEARHVSLTHRDHVIGIERELALSRARVRSLRVEVRSLREEAKRLRADVTLFKGQRNKARAEITKIRSSRTWRVGQAVLRPFRIFRR